MVQCGSLDDSDDVAEKSCVEDGSVEGFLSDEVQDGGNIGEEYCWIHDPGGWTCVVCRSLAERQEEVRA